MEIYPVRVDLPLPPESLIDIFFLQWRTPMNAEEGLNPDIAKTTEEYKLAVFKEFAGWLISHHQEGGTGPIFVVAPEISTPISCLAEIKQLAESLSRPAVIIAGLEHVGLEFYGELVKQSNNPNKDAWVKDLEKFKKVNAAQIWVRGLGVPAQVYIQPKLRPNNYEQQLSVYPADDVLFFHHKDIRAGYGVNFLVQICSDFCDKHHVATLRQKIHEKFEDSDIRVDLTVLIQCNEDQTVPQFRDAANVYYDVANRTAITEHSALLYFNNASRNAGKAAAWGDSQFLFKYKTWRRHGGEDTFHWREISGESWQAAIMREPGPSVYWFKYKPHYLVAPQPSADLETPFVFALNWLLPKEPPKGDGTSLKFNRIPAITHWLIGEWSEGRVELAKQLREKLSSDRSLLESKERVDAAELVIGCYTSRYEEQIDQWRQALGAGDDKARSAITFYFICDLEFDGYPSRKGKNREPLDWSDEAARAVKQWLRIFTLMSIGTQTRDVPMKASPEWGYHALIEDTRVVFLWGGKRHTDRSMAERYIDLMPQTQKGPGSVLLVFIDQEGSPSAREKLLRNLNRIDKPRVPKNLPTHLQPGGTVVNGEQWNPLFLHADHLVDVVDSASEEEFIQALTELIGSAELAA